jgi:hypothetical protein
MIRPALALTTSTPPTPPLAATFNGPAFLASALINGDYSSLESNPDDMRAARRVLAWVRVNYGPRASIVSCGDCNEDGYWYAGNCWGDVTPPRVGTLAARQHHFAGDVTDYTVLYRA